MTSTPPRRRPAAGSNADRNDLYLSGASGNYTLNEVLGRAYDRLHPVKHSRPVPAGKVSHPACYVQWIALMLAGVALGTLVSRPYAIVVGVLWCGCLYIFRPSQQGPALHRRSLVSDQQSAPNAGPAGISPDPTVIAPPRCLSYWMMAAILWQ